MKKVKQKISCKCTFKHGYKLSCMHTGVKLIYLYKCTKAKCMHGLCARLPKTDPVIAQNPPGGWAAQDWVLWTLWTFDKGGSSDEKNQS